MEPGSYLKEASNSPKEVDAPFGGRRNPRQDLEKRALAGAVASDECHHVAALNIKVDVLKRPQRLEWPLLERRPKTMKCLLSQRNLRLLVPDPIRLGKPLNAHG